jgi:hypothetical protein
MRACAHRRCMKQRLAHAARLFFLSRLSADVRCAAVRRGEVTRRRSLAPRLAGHRCGEQRPASSRTIAPVRAVANHVPRCCGPSARRQQSTWSRRLCSIGALPQCRLALCLLADSDRGRWMACGGRCSPGALLYLKSGGAALRSANGGAARLSGAGRPACGWPIRLCAELRGKPLKSWG